MSKQNQDVYAPVNAKNSEYDKRTIVDDQQEDPIQSEAEDAIAAIKGHIERQDMEGADELSPSVQKSFSPDLIPPKRLEQPPRRRISSITVTLWLKMMIYKFPQALT